jgi:uncharacterized iron-regulated membrane protein
MSSYLDWHKGHFGVLNLEVIYPFLNALGLLVLLFTGISLWLHMRRTPKKPYSKKAILQKSHTSKKKDA